MEAQPMSARLVLRFLGLGALLVVLARADKPAKPLKIYIETDMEGASGAFQFNQTREKQWYTLDANGVVAVGDRPLFQRFLCRAKSGIIGALQHLFFWQGLMSNPA
jgi:hypothetical protein